MASQPHNPAPHDALSTTGGIAMITLTLAGWTSIPLFLRHFASSIDAWTANGWRYGISALIWLPVLFIASRSGTTPKGLWKAALVPSLFNIAAQICFALAPYLVEPGLMTFSMRLQIVFLTGGAALFFAAERKVIRSPGFIVGMSLVILGTIGTLWLRPGGLGGGTALGVTLSIAAGLLYAGYALAVRHYMYGMRPIVAFAAVSQYTAGAILALMFLLGTRGGMTALDLSGLQFFLLFLSAVIGIGLGHTLYFASIARLGLAVSAGVVQLQPITVSIVSFFIFGERLTLGQWSCGVAAIVGAGVMLYAQHRAAKRSRSRTPTAPEETPQLLCAQCGYNLEGLAEAIDCPKCGVPSTRRRTASAR
ncbi:MAG: DMT family transporter [Phycisphaerales bacterium]|nr:DMT family transporter [Phycisphaerales bacterium]